jgi:hypothetical protein
MIAALENIIDLSRYPLHQGDSVAWRALVRDKREQLETRQYCRLPGFLLDEQRRKIVCAIEARLDQANRADNERNIYLALAGTESLPDDHPRNIFARGRYHMFGAHLLDPESSLKTLYFSAMMQQFTAAIVGEDRLYPSDDPYQPVNVLCHGKGDRSAWHFDSNNAFTMTVMLQAPEAGGSFEIAPNTRSDENPNYAGVAGLLRGDRSGVECVARNEGELVIFRGCHSAHRVTPIEGERRRLMCVMVYETSAGVLGDPVVNETVYGIKQA